MVDEEGTVLLFRGCIEEHSLVVFDGCVKADMYVRAGMLLVERSCRRWS